MANICTTMYKFYSKDKSKIEHLCSLLNHDLDHDGNPCTCEEDIVKSVMGISSNSYECFGEIIYLSDCVLKEKDYYTFTLDVDTRWRPYTQIYNDIAIRLCIGLAFQAEELGCEIFDKYDPVGYLFPEECIVMDYCDCEYFTSEIEAINYIVEAYDVDLDKYSESNYKINSINPVDYLYAYHSYSYAESLCNYVRSLHDYEPYIIMANRVNKNKYF